MSTPTMPTPLISLDKKYHTRAGKAVRVLCIDAIHPHFPVIALVEYEPNKWGPVGYTITGQCYPIEEKHHELDLIEDPPKHSYRVALFFESDTKRWITAIEDNTNPRKFNLSECFVRYLTDWIEYDCARN